MYHTPTTTENPAPGRLGRVVIFTIIPAPPIVIPAQAGIYTLRFSVIPVQAGIYTLRFPVIPAQAGIYALRWTPVFARVTGPHLNHLKRNAAKSTPPIGTIAASIALK